MEEKLNSNFWLNSIFTFMEYYTNWWIIFNWDYWIIKWLKKKKIKKKKVKLYDKLLLYDFYHKNKHRIRIKN